MQEERYAKLNITIKNALRDCFEDYPEWFSRGNVPAIERYVLKSLKPILLDVLQLSYGDGVLACMYQTAQPESE
jgi:hypothetical protein